MGVLRSVLLAGSQSQWLRERAPRLPFVRRGVARFMPGETVDDALGAARTLREQGIATVFTQLGENVTDSTEAHRVAEDYVDVLSRIRILGLPTEVSVKLTQLGLDLDPELCSANLDRIVQCAGADSTVWIDMEASNYVDATLDAFRRARSRYPNVGVCLQAYLYRTANDLESLLPLGPAIRLVKGAYSEPPDIAFPRKKDVDENYFRLASAMLDKPAQESGLRAAIATHDLTLIRRIQQLAASRGLDKDAFEFQMLFGIQRDEQLRLAHQGWRSTVLVAYGNYWYPWFMRRLAERPANVWFVIRNIV